MKSWILSFILAAISLVAVSIVFWILHKISVYVSKKVEENKQREEEEKCQELDATDVKK